MEILFGTAQIEIESTPATFWSALKDVGGMVSLMFFVAIIAGCRHTRQFNESLKKAFHRATNHHKQSTAKQSTVMEDMENMSVSTRGSGEVEL